ncbi:hypothetical protein [Streptomyces lancefieldiae]|uniref:Uncharacterized protein n=1 Tax=Streptomyces lancefieldiae TaxID=3075520 RepID=A0ABU3AH88_9ACTN|nr:hypothetical protein [Streptomyces sp. DSM 40712]MDT0608912.1 hypothetical protein [Streptomyces sp. DSM 40712]
MAGRPGDGCNDSRETHPHWCGTCGAQRLFSTEECRLLVIVPPCPRCQSAAWKDVVDELTAPDYREAVRR